MRLPRRRCRRRPCRLGLDAATTADSFPAETPTRGSAELTIVVPTLTERANIALLIDRLPDALRGIDWEVVFVDDDSTDGTIAAVREIAARDHRVRGIRRIARRGLDGACLEGILSSSAPIVAVMDGDLQHDQTHLSAMFDIMRGGEIDMVIASRYQGDGSATGGLSRLRSSGSRLATRLAQLLLKTPVGDPMSDFFMLRRDLVETVAPVPAGVQDPARWRPRGHARQGNPYICGPRLHGQSKLDSTVVWNMPACPSPRPLAM